MRRLWSGAGGKIERSHCRRAWDEFISQVRPTLEALYPTAEHGQEEWDAEEVGRKVARLEKVHKDIADKWKAMFHDRLKMDRAARSIAEMSSGINELYRKVKAAKMGERSRLVTDDEMLIRADSLLAEPPLIDPFEESCRQLFIRHIELEMAVDPKTGFAGTDLLCYPVLLGCIAIEPGVLSGSMKLMSSHSPTSICQWQRLLYCSRGRRSSHLRCPTTLSWIVWLQFCFRESATTYLPHWHLSSPRPTKLRFVLRETL